jgi:hypothetical protein
MKSKKQLQRYRAMIGSPARDASRSNSLVFAPGRWAWNAIAGHPATSIAGWERLCKACWSWRRREGGMRIFAAWKLRTWCMFMIVYAWKLGMYHDLPVKKSHQSACWAMKNGNTYPPASSNIKNPWSYDAFSHWNLHWNIETSIETGIFRVACLWMMSGCLVKSSSQP